MRGVFEISRDSAQIKLQVTYRSLLRRRALDDGANELG